MIHTSPALAVAPHMQQELKNSREKASLAAKELQERLAQRVLIQNDPEAAVEKENEDGA